jgi:hypothetical protein
VLYAVVRLVGFEPTISRLRSERLRPLANNLVKLGAMYRNRTRLGLIDNQVPRQSAYIAWSSHVDSNQNLSLRKAAPLSVGRWLGTWYGYRDLNPNLNVRSVLSCPLNDTRIDFVWPPRLRTWNLR